MHDRPNEIAPENDYHKKTTDKIPTKEPAVIPSHRKPDIVFHLYYLTSMIAQNAVDKGFRTREVKRNAGELIALMHSELSEGLEAVRKQIESCDHIPEFSGIEEEMADTIIRILDFGDEYGLRIPEAIVAKHNYNTTRPHKHGKQF